MRAYVLIEAKLGMAREVGENLRRLALSEANVLSVDTVTGPFDVIALLEAADLDRLGQAVAEAIQSIEGVGRTTTCLVVRL
ncbi:MAG: Lrp/AsnC ligand binding domain-containing protein [Dehalococcoidia bacterium]